MSTLFDLEQKIMECWRITSDLDALHEAVIESDLTKDQIANIALGMYQLYDLKFDQLFRMFEQHTHEYYALKNETK